MPGEKAPEEVRREQILRAAYEIASHKGIDGLTMRAVAAEAKLSHGLVHFHFERKGQLVIALLDWLLASMSVLRLPEEVLGIARPVDRLHAILRQEMDRLSHEPQRMRLFFEYWALGTRRPEIQARISAELERYRSTLREVAEEVLRTEPAALSDVTPDGLAAVAVGFINGCAVQAMIDPEHFDIGEYLTAVHGMLERFAEAEA